MAASRKANGQTTFEARWLLAGTMLLAALTLAATGCGRKEQPQEVIVYTALDDVFSQPILDQFQQETGITVRVKGDTESTKTIGLARTIVAEKERPRCDLFWNNEILQTLLLERQGLLRPVSLAAADNFDSKYRSPSGTWYGFAARARVLVVNTNQLTKARYPKSIRDLADPQWRDRVGIAKPLAGTTATHAAALWVAMGPEEARRFFISVRNNAAILSGNRDVAARVASGALTFGLTDTDDAMVEIEAGSPVAIIYPDQKEDELGTLFLPNTLAFIKDSPNPTSAEKLAEYLLSAKIEDQLAAGSSAQIPLNNKSQAKPKVETPDTVKAMEVDFAKVAEEWDAAYKFLQEEFAAAQ
jgi:iron(III) transport system substrate-binding protein